MPSSKSKPVVVPAIACFFLLGGAVGASRPGNSVALGIVCGVLFVPAAGILIFNLCTRLSASRSIGLDPAVEARPIESASGGRVTCICGRCGSKQVRSADDRAWTCSSCAEPSFTARCGACGTKYVARDSLSSCQGCGAHLFRNSAKTEQLMAIPRITVEESRANAWSGVLVADS